MERPLDGQRVLGQLGEYGGRIGVGGLLRGDCKDLRQVTEKQRVLEDVVFELPLRQRPVAQPHDERVGELGGPDRLGEFTQVLAEFHD
jgi:hypothetical protein